MTEISRGKKRRFPFTPTVRDEAIFTDLYFAHLFSTEQIASRYWPAAGSVYFPSLNRAKADSARKGGRRDGLLMPMAPSVPSALRRLQRPREERLASDDYKRSWEPETRRHRPDAEVRFGDRLFFIERQTRRAKETAAAVAEKVEGHEARADFVGDGATAKIMFACDERRDMAYALDAARPGGGPGGDAPFRQETDRAHDFWRALPAGPSPSACGAAEPNLGGPDLHATLAVCGYLDRHPQRAPGGAPDPLGALGRVVDYRSKRGLGREQFRRAGRVAGARARRRLDGRFLVGVGSLHRVGFPGQRVIHERFFFEPPWRAQDEGRRDPRRVPVPSLAARMAAHHPHGRLPLEPR